MRVFAVGLISLVLLVTAACGETGGRGTQPRSDDPASDSFTAPPSAPSDKGLARTLTGTVEEGVEHGCWILRAADREYLLVGMDPAQLRVGSRVVVSGVLEPDLVTTCQQGTPFKVREIRPA